LSQITANTVWEVEVGGSNSNGGAFDGTISGAGTDYSQQTTAQASGTVTSVSTTVTATSTIFTAAMVGNYITDGTNWYLITGYTSTTIVTVNSAPSWTAASIAVGGCLADLSKLPSLCVNGNTIYVKAGTYSIASAGIDFNDAGIESITIIGYDTNRTVFNTDTRPVLEATSGSNPILQCFYYYYIFNIIFNENSESNYCVYGRTENVFWNCVFENGYGVDCTGSCIFNNCYFYNISNTVLNGNPADCYDCVFYECSAYNSFVNTVNLYNCIVAGCGRLVNVGLAFNVSVYGGGYDAFYQANYCVNCIVYGSSGYGFNDCVYVVNCAGGSNTSIQFLQGFITLSADPYNNPSGGDFSLNNTSGGGAACLGAGIPGVFPGISTTGYMSVGAWQAQAGGGGSAGGGSVIGSSVIVPSRF
jgi:hypothetical protein